jgi:hypothetical protein
MLLCLPSGPGSQDKITHSIADAFCQAWCKDSTWTTEGGLPAARFFTLAFCFSSRLALAEVSLRQHAGWPMRDATQYLFSTRQGGQTPRNIRSGVRRVRADCKARRLERHGAALLVGSIQLWVDCSGRSRFGEAGRRFAYPV